MSIKANIIADSINMSGNRLTTYILEYPRFVHAEFMTHRMFSKNAASSRAIPIEKMIEQIIVNPAMPVWWGKNQSGMQALEELDNTIRKEQWFEYLEGYDDREMGRQDSPCGCGGATSYNLTDLETVKIKWLQARDEAIYIVKDLNKLGLHKQIANRLLEPWFNIRIICSATEYENFFALRAHKDAQPEIQALAYKMLEEYNKSTPKKLEPGMWHIPFGDSIDENRLHPFFDDGSGVVHLNSDQFKEELSKLKRKIAVARCARISYLNFEGKDDYEADVKLCDRLFSTNPKHLSPTEHVAEALDNSQSYGNFKGFKQFRYFFKDQNLTDNRVKKIK